MLHIFVCHYTKLYDRKTHILQQLSELSNIVIHFIDEFDKEYIDDPINLKYFCDSQKDIQMSRTNFYRGFVYKPLTYAEKSLAMKHYISFKKILSMEIDYALIIEDDCVFCDDFINELQHIISVLPCNWDVYFPNSTAVMFHIPCEIIENNDTVVKRPHPATAYTLSYLIKKSTCEKVISEIESNKIACPIDHELNSIFYKHDCQVYFNKYLPLITCANFTSSIQSS